MRKGRSCRGDAAQRQVGGEQTRELPMRRHVHMIYPTAQESAAACLDRQLCELNQIMDYQNKILTELLAAVRGLDRTENGPTER